MIESLIFYNNKTGMNALLLGEKKVLFNNEEYSEMLGPLFSCSKISGDFEKNDKGFILKSKMKNFFGFYNKSILTQSWEKEYGVIIKTFPEEQNIFTQTLAEAYSLIEDECIILGIDYKNEVISFLDYFSEKFSSSELLEAIVPESVIKDYGRFSSALLQSMRFISGSKNSNAYLLCESLLNEQKKYLKNSAKDIEKLEILCNEYNQIYSSNLSLNSSLIVDYGKSKELLRIFKDVLYYEFDSPIENNSAAIIDSRISFGETHLSEVKYAIEEYYEDAYCKKI